MSEEISYDVFEVRENTLKKRYPYLFSGMEDFEIPYGWIGVVDVMCVHVNAVIPEHLRKYFTFTQLKEKFGAGRFYWSQMETGESPGIEDLLDVDIHELISNYEVMAQHTCFICGSPARTVYGNWTSALCVEHEADQTQDEGPAE